MHRVRGLPVWRKSSALGRPALNYRRTRTVPPPSIPPPPPGLSGAKPSARRLCATSIGADGPQQADRSGALSHIRVLDLSRVLAGTGKWRGTGTTHLRFRSVGDADTCRSRGGCHQSRAAAARRRYPWLGASLSQGALFFLLFSFQSNAAQLTRADSWGGQSRTRRGRTPSNRPTFCRPIAASGP
jgi:hypothetical protein